MKLSDLNIYACCKSQQAYIFNVLICWELSAADVLDGGWYRVTVPDKGKSNTIIITVDPLSDGGNPREAIIEMQAGNAFTKISISQQ